MQPVDEYPQRDTNKRPGKMTHDGSIHEYRMLANHVCQGSVVHLFMLHMHFHYVRLCFVLSEIFLELQFSSKFHLVKLI